MATSTRDCHCPWCSHSEVLDKVRETKLGSLKVQGRVFKSFVINVSLHTCIILKHAYTES